MGLISLTIGILRQPVSVLQWMVRGADFVNNHAKSRASANKSCDIQKYLVRSQATERVISTVFQANIFGRHTRQPECNTQDHLCI